MVSEAAPSSAESSMEVFLLFPNLRALSDALLEKAVSSLVRAVAPNASENARLRDQDNNI